MKARREAPVLIGRPAVRVGLLALCLLPGIVLGWRFWRGWPSDPFAPNHQLVVMDYLNLWAGGHLARAGRLGLVFDPAGYANWLWSVFGHRLDMHSWGYPPHLLFLAIPLSLLPLVPGFLVWVGATNALLWAVLRRGGLPVGYALASVFSPAGLENALLGQNAAFTTAGLAGGLLLSQRRPVVAGALLALLTVKPQFGLLVPVCLVAARDWRTIAATAAFSILYCGAGLAVFGWTVWRTYITITAPFMRGYIEAPFGLAAHYIMVPPFITMRAAGAGVAAAYAVQAAATAVCAGLSWWAWVKARDDRRAAVALVLLLAPLATPYAHAYDLVSAAVGCAILAMLSDAQGGVSPSDAALLLPAWVWPGSALAIGMFLCPGLGWLFVAPAVWLAVRHLRDGPPVGAAGDAGGR
jgi:Glycosyltransferase family 87